MITKFKKSAASALMVTAIVGMGLLQAGPASAANAAQCNYSNLYGNGYTVFTGEQVACYANAGTVTVNKVAGTVVAGNNSGYFTFEPRNVPGPVRAIQFFKGQTINMGSGLVKTLVIY
ncbi:hypothetical protein [Arthrobacter glacialis]|uniref:Streptomyces killer toxin-like beta/gamma crystallin domain-containing protein n=1 Tax=Arthrobacter glacialis TaxID=1664 RepID=A0A2S3ZSV3_ARTGL|nr:hypothetical protein [Arthrobacter glacialis]POH72174.1 hypothetical protein CVS27_16910 [Arthrobacter glacialis]